METATTPRRKTHKEMHEGINGSGNAVYLVVTVCDETGRWLWQERFTNKQEAEHWMKWA